MAVVHIGSIIPGGISTFAFTSKGIISCFKRESFISTYLFSNRCYTPQIGCTIFVVSKIYLVIGRFRPIDKTGGTVKTMFKILGTIVQYLEQPAG